MTAWVLRHCEGLRRDVLLPEIMDTGETFPGDYFRFSFVLDTKVKVGVRASIDETVSIYNV